MTKIDIEKRDNIVYNLAKANIDLRWLANQSSEWITDDIINIQLLEIEVSIEKLKAS